MSEPTNIVTLLAEEHPFLQRLKEIPKVRILFLIQAIPLIPKRNSILSFLSVPSPSEYILESTNLENIIRIFSQHLRNCTLKVIRDQSTIIAKMKVRDFKETLELTERLALNLEKNLDKIKKSQRKLPATLQLKNLGTEFPMLSQCVSDR